MSCGSRVDSGRTQFPRLTASVSGRVRKPSPISANFFGAIVFARTQVHSGMERKGERLRIGIAAAALTTAVLVAGSTGIAAATTDVLTVGTVNVSSGTGQVSVPIFIQDNTGTPIGRDQDPGFRISGFGIQVVYGPNACIDTPALSSQQISLTGGILATQSADFDFRAKQANTSQSWTYSSAEANGLIPFTAAAAPGDKIGTMVFNLTGCPAGTINLVITTTGPAAAALSSDSGASETVANGGLTVVNGAINISTGKAFWTVPPCRVIDTRNPDGPLGGPALVGSGPGRTFTIVNQCGIPFGVAAVSVNVTITGPTTDGFLTFYPTGSSPPLNSTINFRPGLTRANNAILSLAPTGNFDVACGGTGTVHFILDVNGYFP
jgi:hypothetical protein